MAFGRQVGSIKDLKKNLERGKGTFIQYIPKQGGRNVRFLDEPENWLSFREVFDQVKRKSYPAPEEGQPGYPGPDDRVSTRYLCNAVDVDTDKVIPIQLPKDLANQLVVRYERYNTITDRDYELFRSGEGLDTVYGCTPDSPTARKLDKYKPLDLEQVLEDAYANVWGPDASTPAAGGKATNATGKALQRKPKAAEPDPADEQLDLDQLGEDADADDIESQEALTELADANGIDPEKYATWAEVAEVLKPIYVPDFDDTVVEDAADEAEDATEDEAQEDGGDDAIDTAALATAADDDGDEDAMEQLTTLAEEYGLDPEVFPTWAELSDAIVTAAEGGEADAEGEGVVAMWSEDDLTPKPIGELRAIARDLDPPIVTTGLKKSDIIAAIVAHEPPF